MSKEGVDSLENNHHEKRYSEHICVSKTVKRYIIVDCKRRFLELNPELEGSHITHNQIETALIKSYLGIFTLKDGRVKRNRI